MRKSNNNNRRKMQTPVSISTTLNEAAKLKTLVERMVDRGFTMGYSLVKAQPGWRSVDASAVETFVNVDMRLMNNDRPANIPLNSYFLFTCIKSKEDRYRLTWVNSLS